MDQKAVNNALLTACSELDFDRVRALIAEGAEANYISEHGENAISECIHGVDWKSRKKAEAVSPAEGQDDIETFYKYYIPANREYTGQAIQIISYLLEHGADINPSKGDDDIDEPLREAYFCAWDISMMRFLLEHGADPNDKRFSKEDPDARGRRVLSTTLDWVCLDYDPDIYGDEKAWKRLEEMEKCLRSFGAKRYEEKSDEDED